MSAMNLAKLRPVNVVRLINSTAVGAVLNDRQLRRHRNRAGFRISDDSGETVNLFKYAAWLREQLHIKHCHEPQSYEEKKAKVRRRNLELALAGRDIGELPVYCLKAQDVISAWVRDYNEHRFYAGLCYIEPAEYFSGDPEYTRPQKD